MTTCYEDMKLGCPRNNLMGQTASEIFDDMIFLWVYFLHLFSKVPSLASVIVRTNFTDLHIQL